MILLWRHRHTVGSAKPLAFPDWVGGLKDDGFSGNTTVWSLSGEDEEVTITLTAELLEGVKTDTDNVSGYLTELVERELRGQVLDEYPADYESRKGPVSEQARQRARQVFGV